jgi:putative SOS response-associated peptidase YedK
MQQMTVDSIDKLSSIHYPQLHGPASDVMRCLLMQDVFTAWKSLDNDKTTENKRLQPWYCEADGTDFFLIAVILRTESTKIDLASFEHNSDMCILHTHTNVNYVHV